MGDVYDRVMCGVTGTPGTGTITLGAAERSATNGDFLTFAEAGVPNGAIVSYVIIDGNKWAKGRRGVYSSSGNTLARDAAEINWSGSAQAAGLLNLTSAAKVFITALGADIGGLEWLQSGTISSAVSAVDITTGIDDKSDEYEIHLFDFLPSANALLYLLLSGDGGASYRTGATDYSNVGVYNNSTTVLAMSQNAAGGYISPINVTAVGRGLSGKVTIYKPSANQRTRALVDAVFSSVGSGLALARTSGFIDCAVSAPSNAARLAFSTGNIVSGSYAFYRVKK